MKVNQVAHTDEAMHDFIDKLTLRELLSYNVINRKYFLFEALRHKPVIDQLMEKFESTAMGDVPLFMMCSYHRQNTPFDVAVRSKQMSNIKKLLQLMIKYSDQGLLNAPVIDRNVVKLWKLGVALKPYFSSTLAYKSLQGYYPEYHQDDRTLLIPANEASFRQVSVNYDKIVGGHLKWDDRTRRMKTIFRWTCMTIFLPLLIIYLLCMCFTAIRRQSEDAKKRRARRKRQAEEDQIKQEFEMEFNVVMLKHSLTHKKKRFMLALEEACNREGIGYLDIPAIQTIIHYKWKTYAMKYYKLTFMMSLLFVCGLLCDLIMMKEASGNLTDMSN